MPDWRDAAQRGLSPLGLNASRQEEIIAEVSNHLEDLCEDLIRQGKSEEEAARLALSAIANQDELRLKISCAEQEGDIMNHRVKALWFPGAGTTVLFMALFQFFQPWLFRPHATWAWHDSFLVLNWQWLLCLPTIGAFAAYWSRRAGGSDLERAMAASSPGLGMCCFLAALFSLVLVHDLPSSVNSRFLATGSLGLLFWGFLPAFALLLGAFPFLRGDTGESRQTVVSN